MRCCVLLLCLSVSGAASTHSIDGQAPSAAGRGRADDRAVTVIHAFAQGLAGVRAANPDVHLSVGRDPSFSDEPVLLVEYPAPGSDPAGRDVRCDAENRDWSVGRAIAFQIRPSRALRLSVSFVDRNGVVYTSWLDLQADAWQRVRLAFDEMRPNPYFQPPNARSGAPIDVSDVAFIAFAPQDRSSGRLSIGRIVMEGS